jgi:hypothetical protein
MSINLPGSITAQGITIQFLPVPNATSATTLDDGNEYYITGDEMVVTLNRRSLSVNGVFFGDVVNGSHVLIQHGEVLINGERRNI